MDRPLTIVKPKLYTPEELKQIHTGLTDVIRKMNILLFKYYKNDRRLQPAVLNVISLANSAINDADHRYILLFKDTAVGGGDPGTLRNDMMNKRRKYSLREGNAEADISASELEGWMQICKTPEAALESASRYSYLSFHNRTDEGEKEYRKPERMKALEMDFSQSHRYMLEKENYSQQDMDYAFALKKKERNSLADDVLRDNNTSSAVYQSLYLEKVFTGMKARFTDFISENEIDEHTNAAVTGEWLDHDMTACITEQDGKKKEVMTMIVRAMDKALGHPDREDLLEHLMDLIRDKWIHRLFTAEDHEHQNEELIDTGNEQENGNGQRQLIRNAYDRIMDNGDFYRHMDAIVLRVISQRPQKKQDELMIHNR